MLTNKYLTELRERTTLHPDMSVNDKTIVLDLIAEIDRLLRIVETVGTCTELPPWVRKIIKSTLAAKEADNGDKVK